PCGESGRTRALRAVVPAGAQCDAEPEPRGARAARAVARRPLHPLPVRPQPRLDVADAAGDAHAARGAAALAPAGARRLPRDAPGGDVLLLPGGEADQPELPAARARVG